MVSARPRKQQSIGVVKWCLWKKEQKGEQRSASAFLAAARNKGLCSFTVQGWDIARGWILPPLSLPRPPAQPSPLGNEGTNVI